MRPFIGITCSAEPDGRPVARPPYIQAVHAAGGLPVPLPFLGTGPGQSQRDADEEARLLVDRLDGLVLSGSEDLDSALWGEPLHPAAELMHAHRQRTELAVCRALIERDVPTLAICGGMQSLNVVAGGTVLQHIPDREGGSTPLDHAVGVDAAPHPVCALAGSRLAALCGTAFDTNTAHHQAVGRLSEEFTATAHTDDGILEAFESDTLRFLIAVQWHPERMPSDAGQRALFEALIEAAQGAARNTTTATAV